MALLQKRNILGLSYRKKIINYLLDSNILGLSYRKKDYKLFTSQ